MAMPEDFLSDCKAYMRVELEDNIPDDNQIINFIGAAVEYFADAGIQEPDVWTERYKLIVKAETLHLYDHRDDLTTDKPFPPGIRPFINQLKNVGEITRIAGGGS